MLAGIEKVFLFDVFCKVYLATDSSPVDMQSYELMSDVVDVLVDVSLIYAYESAEKVPFDSRSQAVIRLNNGYVLFLEQMSTTLALVCLLRGDQFQERRSWIEFNFSKFKENLSKMYS
jgi:Ras-related GTP-binding protein C/D